MSAERPPLVKIDQLDYELPEELIAEQPSAERDGARMLLVDEDLKDGWVRELPQLLPRGALLVVNDTRVLPARLFGVKASGGRVELLLLERTREVSAAREVWLALARASKALRVGTALSIDGGEILATVCEERRADGRLLVELATRDSNAALAFAIERAGHVPLPPYIRRADAPLDRERYQTVFASKPGAVAAPTAGLHLSQRMLTALGAHGIAIAPVTLHVSLGTFQPVKVADLDDHEMHEEAFEVSAETARAIALARERQAPVVALGTTTLRALESAADPNAPGLVCAGRGRTRLLIQPGFAFRIVDALMTNFHLPRSTLLALVSAFAGIERTRSAYREAIARRYRFYSYGDAMLIRERAS